MKTKKLQLPALLVLLMITLCGTINAQTDYGIKIAGTPLTSANAEAITNAKFPNLGLAAGTITYDHSKKTFTLTDVNASVLNGKDFIEITATAEDGEYKINLAGNNAVVTTNFGTSIGVSKDLTVEGSGTLKLTSANIAIWVGSAKLTIKNTTVEATGINGIRGVDSSKLVIQNSTVKATGTNGSVFGFEAITLTGCKVTQPAGAKVATDSLVGEAVMLNNEVVKTEVVIEPVPLENYGIKIACQELTNHNTPNIDPTNFPSLQLNSGTITYDHAKKTLTLDNVKASTLNNCIFFSTNMNETGTYTINLVGTNQITCALTGIIAYSNLTIEGSGSLNITSTNGSAISISRKDVTLTIRNTTLEAIGLDYGIRGVNGKLKEKLIVENSTVKAKGTNYGSINYFQTITLNSCDVALPVGATVDANGTSGQAVMKDGAVVTEQVVIEPVKYGIKIAGKELTEGFASAINNANFPNLGLTTGTITYNHSTKTFTLTDVNASVLNGERFIDITADAANGEYKIKLVGNNAITTYGFATSIVTVKDLTVEGTGSLKITSGNNAIHVQSATLTIKNTAVEAKGDIAGIVGNDGKSGEILVIDNASVKAFGGEGGIYRFQYITLTNCNITQPAGAKVDYNGTKGKAIMLNGEVVKETVIKATNTGIFSPLAEPLTIYPNPAKDFITIATDDVNGTAITITDLAGRTVMTATATESKTTLDISRLNAGTYIIRAGNRTAKVVVK